MLGPVHGDEFCYSFIAYCDSSQGLLQNHITGANIRGECSIAYLKLPSKAGTPEQ